MRTLIVAVLLGLTGSAFSAGWIQKSDFGGIARHRTVMLTVVNKIYTGMGHYNGGGVNVLFDDWWEYDPGTNAWSQKADYAGGPSYHSAGFTIGNYAYVGTGRISPTSNTLTTAFYRYDPASNTWITRASLPGTARRGAVAFALNGYGYLGTGETNTGDTATFYQYNPATDSWVAIATFPGGARNSAVAFSIGGYGYVGTGNAVGSQKDFWQYNPALNQWVQKADVGTTNRQEATGFSLNGKGYIGTGADFSSGNNFGDMWEYNVTTNTWTQIADFDGTARRYLCATSLHNTVAYVGLGTNGTNFKDFWAYDYNLALLENDLDKISFTIGPNPATDHITIRVNGLSDELTEEVQIKVLSLNGKEVYSDVIEDDQITIHTMFLEKGLYLYSLVYKDYFLKSGKFTVN